MAVGRTTQDRWRDRLPQPVAVGEGRTAVRLELVGQGRDLVLLVGGGETHVGAVAAAEPGGGGRMLALGRHREGPLAEAAAVRLAAAAGCACAVVAGIHQDAATPEEIAAIVANVELGVQRLAETLEREAEE